MLISDVFRCPTAIFSVVHILSFFVLSVFINLKFFCVTSYNTSFSVHKGWPLPVCVPCPGRPRLLQQVQLHWFSVLRIRDVSPGSRIRIFSIPYPDPNFSINEFKYFNPMFRSSLKYDPGCSSRIRIPDPDPDPGSRGQKGTGSRIRIRYTDNFRAECQWKMYFIL